MSKSRQAYALRLRSRTCALVTSALLAGCGPTAHIPTRPIAIASALSASDPAVHMAHSLAPMLYLQRDEWFRLERVVAVVHPNRPIIGYYLLWRDDVHGAWIPFTKATDEEIVWVGYDSTHAPTDVWTYWHGKVLHADWRGRGTVSVDVQWGKHGSMPRGIVNDDPMWPRTLSNFWVSSWVGIPDILLGRLSRRGPLCFCHSYGRYRTFDRPVIAADLIDVVVRAEDPDRVLSAFFGTPYSKKTPWP
jgi:hypothetical protein